jgi:ADP-heptose:LPS heptosyltransferase
MESRRILILAEGQLGDLLLLTPVLRSLKKSIPDCHLTVAVVQRRSYGGITSEPRSVLTEPPSPGTSEVLLRSPYVDQVLEIQRPLLRSLAGLARVRAELSIVRRLRSGNYQTVICCFAEDRFCVWAALSGAPVRVGQRDQALGWLLTVRPNIRKEEGGVMRYYCALAKAVGAEVDSERTEFPIPDDARERAARKRKSVGLREGERFAVVHPGASGAYRVWPPERYAAVIDALWQQWEMKTLLCGTAFDTQTLEAVRNHCSVPVVEIALGESVAYSAAIMEGAAVCLSNNSGPRHLALSTGIPSLALAPRFDDRAWGLYGGVGEILTGNETCPVCTADRCFDRMPEGEHFGSYCLRMITVEAVLDRLRKILAT